MFVIGEIVDIIVMTLAVGFIFKDIFKSRPKVEVLTPEYYLKQKSGFNWNDFWYAAAIVAPCIILHEFGHKFVAIAFGMQAVFNASYFGLLFGIILKLISPGFLFFIPAYVSILGSGTHIQFAGIAFAGPFVNLIFWLGSLIVLKKAKLKKDAFRFVFLISKINMLLFVFNMLPIPGFDGFSVYSHLLQAFF